AGVTNLRGHILVVVDLGMFLGVGGQGTTEGAGIIVVGGERAEFGIRTAADPEVSRFRLEEVLEPPPSVAAEVRAVLRGVTADALLVLDGAALLRDQRLFIDQGDGEA